MGAGQTSQLQSSMSAGSYSFASFQALSTPKHVPANVIIDRIKGALFGLLIADALAMPTHWFYGGERQVKGTYGTIVGYVKPTIKLPGSIMSKSNTGGGGRGSYRGNIVGDVIFHGKKKYWAPGADYHYHTGMNAGDNTLEALLVRRVCNITAANGGQFAPNKILEDYVQFLTTPDTHNDVYCGTSHRMFFANMKSGKPLQECPDNDGHNVDSADSIVTSIPVALISNSDEQAMKDAADMVMLTRNSRTSAAHAALFASTLRSVVLGSTVREATVAAGKELGYDVKRVVDADGNRPGTNPVHA